MLGDSRVWSSLEAKVIQERESLFTELKHVQDDLVSCLTQYIIVLFMLCTLAIVCAREELLICSVVWP